METPKTTRTSLQVREWVKSCSLVSVAGLDGKHRKIRTGPQTSLQLCRLSARPEGGQGQTHHSALADLKCKDTETALQTDLSGLPTDVCYL